MVSPSALRSTGPKADPHHAPETRSRQHPTPGVLASTRPADMPGHVFVIIQARKIIDVGRAESRKDQSLRLDRGS